MSKDEQDPFIIVADTLKVFKHAQTHGADPAFKELDKMLTEAPSMTDDPNTKERFMKAFLAASNAMPRDEQQSNESNE